MSIACIGLGLALLLAFMAAWAVGGPAGRPAAPAAEEDGSHPKPEGTDSDRPAPLYTIRALCRTYATATETIHALRDVSADLHHGITGIVGPSGKGKTTLLNCLGGLDEAFSGKLLCKGKPIPSKDPEAMRRFRALSVAWVFQDLNLIGHQTAAENVALPLLCRGVPRKEALAAAERNLDRVGLAGLGQRLPHQLSGGQKQRVAIARAFTADADVILADEPTGSLDPESAELVMSVFQAVSREAGKPVVLVTHNHDLAHKYCDRVLECTAAGLREVTRTPAASPPAQPPAAGAEERLGMRWGQRIRFALADARSRRLMMALNVLVVAVGVVYLLPLGFYGQAVYNYQRGLFERTLPTRVTATCPEVTDQTRRFTAEKIREITRLPWVAEAFPQIELGVKLSVGPASSVRTQIEGTVPTDPAFSTARLCWGRPVADATQPEIILGLPLLRKLGGRLDDAGPTPSTVFIEVSRTVSGREESHKMAFRVVGLVKYQAVDKAYVPLALAEHLDLWCMHKIGTMPGTDGRLVQSEVACPRCFTYVPAEHVERVRSEAEGLRILAEPQGQVKVVEAEGDIWAAVWARGGATPPDETARRAAAMAPGCELAASRLLRLPREDDRAVRVVALGAGDPRWRAAPGKAIPAFGLALAVGPAVGDSVSGRGVVVPIAGRCDRFPAQADCLCSPDTLSWLATDPLATPAVLGLTQVQTDDVREALRWEKDRPGAVAADRPDSYAVYEIGDAFAAEGAAALPDWAAAAREKELPAEDIMKINLTSAWADAQRKDAVDASIQRVLKRCPEVGVGAVHVGTVALTPGPDELGDRGRAPDRRVRARFIPDELFRTLGGAGTVGRAVIPCILLSRTADAAGHVAQPPSAVPIGLPRPFTAEGGCATSRIGGSSLRVVAAVRAGTEELWFPDQQRASIGGEARRVGLAVYGHWKDVCEAQQAIAEADPKALPVRRVLPKCFTMLIEGGKAPDPRRLGPACVATPLRVVQAEVTVGGRTVAKLCALDASLEAPPAGHIVAVSRAVEGEGPARIAAGSSYRCEAALQQAAGLHPDVAAVDAATFRRLAFEIARESCQLPPAGTRMLTAHVPHELAWERAREAFAGAGLILEPLTPLTEQVLHRFSIRDRSRADGSVRSDLLASLAMTKPTFAHVVPCLSLKGSIGGTEVAFETSTPQDPRRFAEGVTYGRWLAPSGSQNELVLPARLLAKLGLRGAPESYAGVALSAEFSREKRISSVEPSLRIPFRIAGITSKETGFLSEEVARRVLLWQQGRLVYNERTMTFDAPAQIYEREGHVRCQIHAKSSEAVAPLVAFLEGSLGYHTQHSLAEQQGLKELGHVLVGLVGVLVLGTVLSAAMTVFITTTMNIQSKTREIGILRTQGAGSRDIVGVFGAQGLLIGMAAFALGSAAVILGEPFLRARIGEAFTLPMAEIVTASLGSPGTWWLFALAFGVAVFFSLVGVFFPALFASRLPLVAALRHRE